MTQVRGYLTIFGALLVLTLVTVGVSSLGLSTPSTITLALAIASAKATLVALFFMHLKGERPMVFWPLALTAVLFVALFGFILWSESDHVTLKSHIPHPTSQSQVFNLRSEI